MDDPGFQAAAAKNNALHRLPPVKELELARSELLEIANSWDASHLYGCYLIEQCYAAHHSEGLFARDRAISSANTVRRAYALDGKHVVSAVQNAAEWTYEEAARSFGWRHNQSHIAASGRVVETVDNTTNPKPRPKTEGPCVHPRGEEPPEQFRYGPVTGNRKELGRWVGEPLQETVDWRSLRTLEAELRWIWIRGRGHCCDVYFTSEDRFRSVEARKASDQSSSNTQAPAKTNMT